jgi:hypothetical protein
MLWIKWKYSIRDKLPLNSSLRSEDLPLTLSLPYLFAIGKQDRSQVSIENCYSDNGRMDFRHQAEGIEMIMGNCGR